MEDGKKDGFMIIINVCSSEVVCYAIIHFIRYLYIHFYFFMNRFNLIYGYDRIDRHWTERTGTRSEEPFG